MTQNQSIAICPRCKTRFDVHWLREQKRECPECNLPYKYSDYYNGWMMTSLCVWWPKKDSEGNWKFEGKDYVDDEEIKRFPDDILNKEKIGGFWIISMK